MTTTTLAAIRAKMATVIGHPRNGLIPTVVSNERFKRSPKNQPIREWALQNGALAFRRFEIRRSAKRIDPGMEDPSAYRVEQQVTVTVCYPVKILGKYGLNDLDDLEDLVEADTTQIRDALASSGNLANGAHQANFIEQEDLDRNSSEIWFQLLTINCVFWASQQLT